MSTQPKNYYDNLPVDPYFIGTLQKADVIAYLNTTAYSAQVQAGALALILNESGNLSNVINGTNCAGIQSDSGKWPTQFDSIIVATADLTDSTGAYRGFVVFDTWQHCADMVLVEVQQRGMYIGANASAWGISNVATSEDVANVYERAWNMGDAAYNAPQSDLDDFASLYTSSLQAISGTAPAAPAPSSVVYKFGDTDATTNGMVSKIQAALILDGSLQIAAPTGNYLEQTKEAVEDFQGKNGLSVDGECGNDTLTTLGL